MNTHTTNTGLDADDRKQLVDSVRRFAERDYGFEARMRALRQDGGYSPDHCSFVCIGGRPRRGDATTCGPVPNASQPADTTSALAKDPITSIPD